MKKLIFIITLTLTTPLLAHRGGPRGGEDSGFREAMESCVNELGITKPEKGERPSQEEREAMDKCMSAQGYEKPEKRERNENENE
jgi:hypothetical protein